MTTEILHTGTALIFSYSYSSDAEVLRGSATPPPGAVCHLVAHDEVNGVPTYIVRWSSLLVDDNTKASNMIFEAPRTMFILADRVPENVHEHNADLSRDFGTGLEYQLHVETSALSFVREDEERGEPLQITPERVTADTLLRDAALAIEDNRERYGSGDHPQGIAIQFDNVADAFNCMRQSAGRVHCSLNTQDVLTLLCILNLANSQTDSSTKSVGRLIGFAAIMGEAKASEA